MGEGWGKGGGVLGKAIALHLSQNPKHDQGLSLDVCVARVVAQRCQNRFEAHLTHMRLQKQTDLKLPTNP